MPYDQIAALQEKLSLCLLFYSLSACPSVCLAVTVNLSLSLAVCLSVRCTPLKTSLVQITLSVGVQECQLLQEHTAA